MKKILAGLVTVAVAVAWTGCVLAEEGGDAPAKAPAKKSMEGGQQAAAVQEMTLVGTLTKETTPVADGKPARTKYTLKDEAGTMIRLPAVKAAKAGEAPAVNLDDYVDAKVKMVVMGVERKMGEKKMIMVREIKSIAKEEAAAQE